VRSRPSGEPGLSLPHAVAWTALIPGARGRGPGERRQGRSLRVSLELLGDKPHEKSVTNVTAIVFKTMDNFGQ